MVLETRSNYFTKLELGLRIAMSKYQAVLPEQTLLGRRHLDTCAACDRPFTRQIVPSGGDRRSATDGGLRSTAAFDNLPPPEHHGAGEFDPSAVSQGHTLQPQR